jgi:hypothetical protein
MVHVVLLYKRETVQFLCHRNGSRIAIKERRAGRATPPAAGYFVFRRLLRRPSSRTRWEGGASVVVVVVAKETEPPFVRTGRARRWESAHHLPQGQGRAHRRPSETDVSHLGARFHPNLPDRFEKISAFQRSCCSWWGLVDAAEASSAASLSMRERSWRDTRALATGRSASKAAAGSRGSARGGASLTLLRGALLLLDGDAEVEGGGRSDADAAARGRSRTKTRPAVLPDSSSCEATRSSFTRSTDVAISAAAAAGGAAVSAFPVARRRRRCLSPIESVTRPDMLLLLYVWIEFDGTSERAREEGNGGWVGSAAVSKGEGGWLRAGAWNGIGGRRRRARRWSVLACLLSKARPFIYPVRVANEFLLSMNDVEMTFIESANNKRHVDVKRDK